jgi:hypothetical protein
MNFKSDCNYDGTYFGMGSGNQNTVWNALDKGESTIDATPGMTFRVPNEDRFYRPNTTNEISSSEEVNDLLPIGYVIA